MYVADASVGLTTNTLFSVVGSDSEPGTYMTGVAGPICALGSLSSKGNGYQMVGLPCGGAVRIQGDRISKALNKSLPSTELVQCLFVK